VARPVLFNPNNANRTWVFKRKTLVKVLWIPPHNKQLVEYAGFDIHRDLIDIGLVERVDFCCDPQDGILAIREDAYYTIGAKEYRGQVEFCSSTNRRHWYVGCALGDSRMEYVADFRFSRSKDALTRAISKAKEILYGKKQEQGGGDREADSVP
jgi:hypothetical protein